jgi:hypothetical protein
MVIFKHRDGERATGAISLSPVRDSVPIDEDGHFEVDPDRDDYDDVVKRLEEAGHDRLEDDDGDREDSADQDNADEEHPQASDYTEEDLVEMGRDGLRSIASHYEDINGNASGDKLTEELITKRREEVSD